MKKFLIASLALASSTAFASEFSLGPKIGTTGVGLEGIYHINEQFGIRVGASGLAINSKFDDSSLKYVTGRNIQIKGQVRVLNIPVVCDWHPWESGLRISAGLSYNGNQVSAKFNPTGSMIIENNTYTKEEVGSTKATIKFGNSIAPIITIGYDGSITSDTGLSFNCEFGIIYAGKPKISIKNTGTNTSKELISDLERDYNKAINRVSKVIKLYPVINIGVQYKF